MPPGAQACRTPEFVFDYQQVRLWGRRPRRGLASGDTSKISRKHNELMHGIRNPPHAEFPLGRPRHLLSPEGDN